MDDFCITDTNGFWERPIFLRAGDLIRVVVYAARPIWTYIMTHAEFGEFSGGKQFTYWGSYGGYFARAFKAPADGTYHIVLHNEGTGPVGGGITIDVG